MKPSPQQPPVGCPNLELVGSSVHKLRNHQCTDLPDTVREDRNFIFDPENAINMRFFSTFAILLPLLLCAQAQQPKPNGADSGKLRPVQPESPIFETREKRGCSLDIRTFDGSCTNLGAPSRKLWASTNRPQFSYFAGRDTRVPRGSDLPSARFISNAISKSSRDVFDKRGLNEMATFFGQFIDHTIMATPLNKSEPLPIKVPEDDPLFANLTKGGNKGELAFFRSNRVRVRERNNEQRPQNSLSSVVDLASVYGPSKERNNGLRLKKGGLLKTSTGDLLPLNSKNFNNAPRTGPGFFLAGDHRANEHPALTSLHTVFLREHNDIARELKLVFPKMGHEDLFQNARKINIAQFQKIVFNDWYPSVTGFKLPRYKGFKKTVDPTISMTFSTAAFRVGHTMVGNKVNRAAKGNKKLSAFSLTQMFFRGIAVIRSNGIEQFLRGALINRAQRIDVEVRDSLRNFLFTGVDGEDGTDLVALNIQRGRDHALPSYNALRVRFCSSKADKFTQITKNRGVASKLQSVYKSAGFVEAWPGLVAEDTAPGSSMGKTMLEIWKTEFRRIRDGDRFYFQVKDLFPKKILDSVPRVKALFTNEDTFRAILLRNTCITEEELPKKMFFWK